MLVLCNNTTASRDIRHRSKRSNQLFLISRFLQDCQFWGPGYNLFIGKPILILLFRSALHVEN